MEFAVLNPGLMGRVGSKTPTKTGIRLSMPLNAKMPFPNAYEKCFLIHYAERNRSTSYLHYINAPSMPLEWYVKASK